MERISGTRHPIYGRSNLPVLRFKINENEESRMNLQEIERKFLVNNMNYKNSYSQHYRIIQGYLNTSAERNVRVRLYAGKGYITVKGESTHDGTTRFEWEKEISVEEARALLNLCETPLIEKERYLVETGKHTLEVDEFFGANQGLVIAEVELDQINETFQKPEWLGEEVTGDQRYYNAYLSKNPYLGWGEAALFSAQ